MSTRSVPIRLLAGATALLVLLCGADCDEDAGNGTKDKAAAPAVAGTAGGCGKAGSLTRDLLPTLAAEETTTIQNPCLKFVDLVGQVTDVFPPGDRTRSAEFLTGVGDLANKVATVSAVAECAYERDRLAIAIYQDLKTKWSMGIVAVVRGDLAAAVVGAQCYLLSKLPIDVGGGFGFRADTNLPTPAFCFDTLRRTVKGDSYTVLWLGSSDLMCHALDNQLNSGAPAGNGIRATVKASPNVVVRAGPSTTMALVGRAQTGAVGVVTCYVEGEKVTGRRGTSNRWDQTTVNDLTGFVADVWLDTGGDITTQVQRCPSN